MITYNEVLERVKKVFSVEFGIESDNFLDEVKLNSLGFTGDLAEELEREICREFEISGLDTVGEEESTIGKIVNEIMIQYNAEHHYIPIEAMDVIVIWLGVLAIFVSLVLICLFFL